MRNTPRKPLKVFLQDGAQDINNQHGSWPLANQELAAALEYAGYDFRFEYVSAPLARCLWLWADASLRVGLTQGKGNHSGTHGASILPDTIRWIWPRSAAKL